jgi:TatD DNase family protein
MTDAHCHPWDLREIYLECQKDVEEERRETGTACAASSWNLEQFEYHESLARTAREEGAPPLFSCFALHPQISGSKTPLPLRAFIRDGLDLLQSLGAEGRMNAVGETCFDLYDSRFKAG